MISIHYLTTKSGAKTNTCLYALKIIFLQKLFVIVLQNPVDTVKSVEH